MKFPMLTRSCRITRVVFVLLSGIALLSGGTDLRSAGRAAGAWAPLPAAQAEPQAPAAKSKRPAHFDHNPKHGGIFFMSIDYKHHLEGVLLPSGTFRLYLYDAHTKPLIAEETRKTSGTVQIGDSEKAPKINLVPGTKVETLEANLGKSLKFPVALTVLLRLPGISADSRPELFNFTFTKFTDEHALGSCNPTANMPNMHC